MPWSARYFTTTRCVEIPAWSVPGRNSVLYPRMRCQRVRMSISVCSSMCPICSEPVTFGGGMTIENTGPRALGSALNRASFTQNSAQRGSIRCGSYALAISRAISCYFSGDSAEVCFRAFLCDVALQGNLRLYGAKSYDVNSGKRGSPTALKTTLARNEEWEYASREPVAISYRCRTESEGNTERDTQGQSERPGKKMQGQV